MIEIDFYYGSYDDYKALGRWDDDTLYFITDRKQIFKGSEEYTKGVEVVDTLPLTKQRQGVLYVRKPEMSLWRYNGSMYEQIGKGYIAEIPTDGSVDHSTVPTTKAVVDYITKKLQNVNSNSDTVQDISYSKDETSIVVFTGSNDAPKYLPLKGVVTVPTWDANQRTLTVPVVGADPLVINFGRESVVTKGSYNPKTEEIELTLSNNDTIKIPVGELIDVYKGSITPTIRIDVNADNTISGQVRISNKLGNKLEVKEDGLFVDGDDRYSNDDIDIMMSNIHGILNPHVSNDTIHITDEERQSWNAKVGADQLSVFKESVLSSASNVAEEKASEALGTAKEYAERLNSNLQDKVSSIEHGLVWKRIPERN